MIESNTNKSQLVIVLFTVQRSTKTNLNRWGFKQMVINKIFLYMTNED